MSKKTKVIRIQKSRPPKVHEVARARGRVNHLGPLSDDNIYSGIAKGEPDPNNTSKIDVGKLLNTASDVGSSVAKSSSGRVGKKSFWDYRDKAYNEISLIHGKESWVKLPGNPFEAFTHAAIHDSPLKNYRSDLDAFNVMLKQYYPEIYATLQGQENVEQRKKNAGTGVDIDINAGSVQEILQGVSSDYIAELQRKKNAGIQLTNAEEKILAAYEYLYGKIKEGAKKKVSQEVGNWLIENWPIVIIGIILLIILLKKK